ncbi:MAG TPA: serine hydrolase, partial [Vicinamibacteria bacterium]|nr:serine hydrolase [Vicinamibacteria bacterium]
MAGKALLVCGFLSSLLYAATDVLGGILYDGYSFASQAISELMAAGAPSEAIVDPLFITYDVLALAFGVGVFREGVRRSRALRMTGALLMGYAAIGLAGPTLFEMHRRGIASLAADAPHIILTGILVLLMLLAIGFGSFALGTRFRVYSFGTLLVMIVFGSIAAPYAARLAAGQPTPGFGILERINIYSSLLWVAVLGIALLRRRRDRDATTARVTARSHLEGMVAPGFEEVRIEFERNFTERHEIGAAVAAYWRGEKIVDLWGGHRTPTREAPWNQDTMVVVMSTTKGLAAMTLALANSRGWLDYDAPVAHYWPEFAQNGKAAVTVRQLLAHEAGLVLLDEKLPLEKLSDLDNVARVLARQTPAWPPGTRHGYHTMTLGLYMQELIRRVDPMHRTLGRFFREEIAKPLDLEFYIGLPREVPGERIATLETLSRTRGLLALRYTPMAVTMKMIAPGSLLRRSFVGTDLDLKDRRSYEVEVPAGNGVGTARAIARAYSAFAEGGAELGITPGTFARLTEPPVPAAGDDVVLGVPSYFSLGFLRPGPELGFGSSPRAFGAPGAGGSFAFADPDARLGYAYVMNRLDFYLVDDPREKALRDAVYRAMARLAERPEDRGGVERSVDPRWRDRAGGLQSRTAYENSHLSLSLLKYMWRGFLRFSFNSSFT